MIFVKSKNTLIYISLVVLIILLSFRSFATHLNPNTNSDTAVQVLMAYSLKLPQDFYYWGQDRLGSIVPILGNALIKITNLSPVEAVAYVNYFFLIIGFLTFTSLFKRLISKFIFALVIFLPLPSFYDILLVGQPYAAQLACIGITTFLIDKITTFTETKSKVNLLLLPLAGVSAILSVWISDFSIITLLLLVPLFLITYIANRRFSWSLKEILTLSYITFVIAISFYLGNVFISYAKSNATASSGSSYGKINNFEQFVQIIKTIALRFYKSFTEIDNIFFTLHNITALIAVASIIIILFQKKYYLASIRTQLLSNFQILLSYKWIIFFLVNAGISVLLLLVSNWVYINDAASRYFVVTYVYFWMFVLLFVEKLDGTVSKKLTILLAITAIFSSLSLPSYVYAFEQPKSKVQQLKDIQTLGKAGFIGDYWSTYIISATNPSLLAATPHEQGGVRCFPCASEVLSSKTIYLIKDKWLTTFPDRIEQFGWRLQKIGEPFIISGYTVAPYKRDSIISSPSKKIVYFPVGEIATLDFSAFAYKGQVKQDSGKILQIPARKESNYVLFGPYVNLPEGIYQVSLKVRSPSENNTNNFLIVADVHEIELKSSQVLVEQKVGFNPSVKERNFVMEFKASKDSYYEFRIATDAEVVVETPTLRRLK